MTTRTARTSRRKATPPLAAATPDTVAPPPGRAEAELHIPLSSRAVFWRPRFAAPAPELEYLPFLFWLVETIRPERSVQIGLGSGVGYLALCQAVERLGNDGSCLGIGRPGTTPLLSPAARHEHEINYTDFSRLIAADPATMTPQGQGGQIDLLIVGMPLDDELVAALHDGWLPQLSPRGVVVLLRDPAEDQLGLPAKALLARLQRPGEHVILDHGHASTLLCALAGPDQPDRLQRLAWLEPGSPGFLVAAQVFQRLGRSLVDAQSSQALRTELDGLTQEATELRERLAKVTSSWNRARDALEAAQKADVTQAEVLAMTQARLADTEVRLRQHDDTVIPELQRQLAATGEALAAQTTAHEQRLATLKTETAAQAAALAAQLDRAERDHAAALTSQATAHEQELAARIDDIAILATSHAETLDQARRDHAADLARQQDELALLDQRRQQELADREAANAALATQLDQARRDHAAELARLQAVLTSQATAHEQEMSARIDDIAILVANHAETLDQVRRDHAAELTRLGVESGRLKRDLAARAGEMTVLKKAHTAALAAQTAHYTKLLETERAHFRTSTSWRLTRPVRAVGGLLRRDPADDSADGGPQQG